MRATLVLVWMLMAHATSVLAFDFGTGPLPVVFEPETPAVLLPEGRIEIEGVIEGTAPVKLVVRIDDAPAPSYADRMNDERVLPPGPFTLSYNTTQLRDSSGRYLRLGSIRQVIVFISGDGAGRLTRFDVSGLISEKSIKRRSAAPAVTIEPAVTTGQTTTAPPARVLSTSTSLPLKFEPWQPVAYSSADEIRVEGIVTGREPASIALRIDDTGSKDYASRFNDERLIPPGPFRFSVGVGGLKTPSGRTLDPGAIARVILFAWAGNPAVTILRFEVGRAASMPPGAHGYAFGGLDAALPAGFERVSPADPRLTGRGPISAIRRPAPDPLVASGLKGVRRVVLKALAPRVRVTVWSEDPGEWDQLPHPLVRRIQVNRHDLINEKRTARQWIAARYLRGAAAEHTAADDAWTAYGQYRGDARFIDVDAINGEVIIELAGANLSAYFINAVVIEPVAVNAAASIITPGQAFALAQRAAWYRTTFPVAPAAAAADDGTVALALAGTDRTPFPALKLRAAPGSGTGVKLAITTDTLIEHPLMTVAAPRLGTVSVASRLWVGHFKLERDGPILLRRDNRLLATTSVLPLRPGQPRGYELWLDVPNGAPPGVYAGKLTIRSRAGSSLNVPLELTVLPVALPQPSKPVGFYLSRPAHLNYFNGFTLQRERQTHCDLDMLRGFGLTNTAPPIGGLERTNLNVFGSDMRRALASGVTPGWLIYNPLTDVLAAQGPARSAQIAATLEALIKAQRLPQPLWSVADEPSNADQHNGGLAEWVAMLRAKSPGIRLAGHLNTPADKQFIPLFDTVILNAGFGIDAQQLQQMHANGKGVWLYNTQAPRQTAGLWMWRTAADRYVQWHARLPSADPFDPLDGREADYQMIYPTARVCPAQPDIHRDLLRMAEGVVDQRWLLWLESQTSDRARALAAHIRATLPGPFTDAQNLSRAALETIRSRIMDLVAAP